MNRETLFIYLDPDEYEKVKVKAEEVGLSVSAFVRRIIRRELHRSESWCG